MLNKLLGNGKSALNLNCSVACLLRDREGMLDQYDGVNLNCGVYIASAEVNARLLAKGAKINAGETLVTDYAGEFVRADGGTVTQRSAYEGVYAIITGDVILKGEGAYAFEGAAGAAVSGTVYYPDSISPSVLSHVHGEKCPYSAGAFAMLGSFRLEELLDKIPQEEKEIWVSGEVTALEEDAVEWADQSGLNISCGRLVTTRGLAGQMKGFVHPSGHLLIPDGHTLTGPLTFTRETPALYGKKLFVRGSLLIEKGGAESLGEMESIIVKGRAALPASCVQAFRAVGKADSYQVYEGCMHTINGFGNMSHEQLNDLVQRGEQLTVTVNGCLLFSEDVTSGDMDAIASLSCNGMVILPGAAHAALSQRAKDVNGMIMDIENLKQLTGVSSLSELVAKLSGGNGNVNTDVYFLN